MRHFNPRLPQPPEPSQREIDEALREEAEARQACEDWPDLEATQPAVHRLRIGDSVRSHDFPLYHPTLGVTGLDLTGERACYAEGVIEGIITCDSSLTLDGRTFGPTMDCDRYVLRVTRIVWEGEASGPFISVLCPPVNGTSTLTGGTTFGVVPIGD